MIYSKIPLAQTITQLCKLYGYKQVVISPGSRNAPLTIGFTGDPFFDCFSIVDERSAAFFALGMAQQNQLPTILVCTSGSALLNYYPAVAEAYYSNIPLLVISADRPKHLIDIGDGQTINQPGVYGKHIVFETNLKTDINPDDKSSTLKDLPIFKSFENKLERFIGVQQDIQEFNEEQLNKALISCMQQSGPVHINVPFTEPLYETTNSTSITPKKQEFVPRNEDISEERIEDLVNKWDRYDKKMILIGVMYPNAIMDQFIHSLGNDPGVLILTETTSNIHNNHIFSHIDRLIAPLSEQDLEDLKPDLIVSLGGMIVSKKIKAFLRKHQPSEHWHIGQYKANDTFFKLSEHIKTSPNKFLEQFLPKVERETGRYRLKWDIVKDLRSVEHSKYINGIGFSDLKVFDILLSNLPDSLVLQLSNSTVVRYSQLFDLPNSIEVYCNRGTSGIDGSTSTAVGCAVARDKQTLLISGDLSFFYDNNALWNDKIPPNFRIIVINNGGGGIFRILPADKEAAYFEPYLETTHNLNAKHLSEMHGFGYESCSDEVGLRNHLSHFFDSSDGPKILEIFTPKNSNDEVLLNYFKALQ